MLFTDVLVTPVPSRVLLPLWAGLAEPFDHRPAVRVKWAPKLSRQLRAADSYSRVAKCYLLCGPMAEPPSLTPETLGRCTSGDLDAGGAESLPR